MDRADTPSLQFSLIVTAGVKLRLVYDKPGSIAIIEL
jgi:hypothetical protein